ncbi:MAG: TonB-dependent receptor [Sphingobacteriaceae bacterium]|nr:TonB-dependent receptor [Sphingobacteriaceae bacterium]
MNLTTILILLFSISVSATGFSQNKINLQVKKSAIADAISQIEEQSSYRFLYNQNLGEIKQKVSVKLEDASIDQALKELLKNSGLSYQFINNELIAIQKTEVSQVDVKVTGKVIDKGGEALIGVSIKVKGTSNGVTTNENGEFALTVPENATLVFSYLGFETLELKLAGQTKLNITLQQSVSQLNEVVVVGYGTQRRAQVATAVASVRGEDIAQRGTVGPLQAIQGQVAGVDIRTASGRAGAAYNIQIRGQNSLNPAAPLFVVDGVIVDNIDFLNSQDIEKIDVLKDAASTAVYGSRGSNGVVQVTTKGKSSVKAGATISYDGYVGIRKIARMPDFMGGDEWFEYRQNAFITPELLKTPVGAYDNKIGGLALSPIFAQIMADKAFTNWRDLVTQTGAQENHWLTVSGRSNNDMSYLIGAGFQNEKGNLTNEFLKRYNFKASVDHKLNTRWAAGASINFALSEMERGSDNAVTNAFRMAPVVPAYDEAGQLKVRPGQFPGLSMTSSVNPLLDNANSQNNTRRYYGLGNLYLQYSPLNWIDIRSTFSPSLNFNRNGKYTGAPTENRVGLLPIAQMDNLQRFSYILDNTLNVRKDFKEHSLGFTGLFSIQSDRFENNSASVVNLPFNSSFYNLGSGAIRENITSGYVERGLVSFMARVNYSYQDKYLASLVTRWDGSSMLSEDHKWASFPSAAVAWRISREPFMEAVTFISDLKIRFSAGYAGNNNGVSPYETQASVSAPVLYDFGGTIASGYTPSRLANQNLTWEKTREYNLGLDFEFLKGRIFGALELYDKVSDGLITARQLPFETGYLSIKDNVASVGNKGVELSLSTINISKKNFTWSTSFKYGRNNNKILELPGGKDLPLNGYFIGKPLNVNYNYVLDGVWQESEKAAALVYGQSPGQARVKDLNNDKKIGPADMTIIGQQTPKWTGGLSTSLNYKRFDFSASLIARMGSQINSTFHQEFANLADRGRAKLNMDYYMPANNVTATRASTFYPQPGNPGPYWAGVGHYRDNSFVKVQNIILGYSIPASLLQKVKISNIRMYANVSNPFIWTDYDGFDPEYANEPLVETGVSNMTYQFGINARF